MQYQQTWFHFVVDRQTCSFEGTFCTDRYQKPVRNGSDTSLSTALPCWVCKPNLGGHHIVSELLAQLADRCSKGVLIVSLPKQPTSAILRSSTRNITKLGFAYVRLIRKKGKTNLSQEFAIAAAIVQRTQLTV